MSRDPRTPVLVGVAALVERPEDPIDAAEPLELMEDADPCGGYGAEDCADGRCVRFLTWKRDHLEADDPGYRCLR